MATRAHLQIVSSHRPNEGILLFHRWDGYPEHMVPVISAFAEHARSLVNGGALYRWGQPDYVAAIIIAWSVGGDWPSLVADMKPVVDPLLPDLSDSSADRPPLWQRPQHQNGSGWGVPTFIPMTAPYRPYSDVEYWYTLMLERILQEDPGDWRLMMHDLEGTDWHEHRDTSRLDPPIEVAQCVDDVITLFHPTEVTYQSIDEFVEALCPKNNRLFRYTPRSIRPPLEAVSPALAFHGMATHNTTAKGPKICSPTASAYGTSSPSQKVEYLELDT